MITVSNAGTRRQMITIVDRQLVLVVLILVLVLELELELVLVLVLVLVVLVLMVLVRASARRALPVDALASLYLQYVV